MFSLLFFFACQSSMEAKQEPEKTDWYIAGKKVYERACIACHKADGSGEKGVFPPLKGSQWLQKEPELLATIIRRGLGGEIIVAGETYRSAMPPQEVSVQELVNVIAYIRFAFAKMSNDVSIDTIQPIWERGGGTIYGQAELNELFPQSK